VTRRAEECVQHFVANQVAGKLRFARQDDAVSGLVPPTIHETAISQWDIDGSRNSIPVHPRKGTG
jgi:hypothetical protein